VISSSVFDNSCSLAAKENVFDVSNFQLKECNPSEPLLKLCLQFAHQNRRLSLDL
jgi:hypothetical protein